MDFQKIVDSMYAMTCVVSVEKLDGDRYGDVRLVAGNKAYIDSIENPPENMRMLTDKFTPNSLYTDYLTRDMNFEAACYRAAVQKKCVHSYAHPDRYDIWFNMNFMPLCPDDGNICYCTYTMEVNFEPDPTIMSSSSTTRANEVLSTCIKLRGATDFTATMQDVIKDIRHLCRAKSCCILLMDKLGRSCSVLCEDSEGEFKNTVKDYVEDVDFYPIAETFEQTIAGSNCIVAKNEADMEIIKERNPVWYESLKEASVDSIILFPLKTRKDLLGYMWAASYDSEDAVNIKETLELTTFVLASEIANYLMVDRLRLLSSRDVLTGVMNRNEMNNLVDRLSKGLEENTDSVGVVFSDLNGLKTVNDNEGHPAGDKLLRDAADALREVFDEEQIFRAGGDEFAVIIKNTTDEELADKVRKLREAADRHARVSFATGYSAAANAVNIRTALRHADENMYEDKRLFYEQHPERKAR
ncbi:MAG: GGDEF domain-containing protein [Lachnospiraceae bacterium]|nr:GGDEF domain-containing protein [Lachnospiraceae bacterium]